MKKYPSMQGSLWWISFYLFAGWDWGTGKICLHRFLLETGNPKGLLGGLLAAFHCFSVKSLQWAHFSGLYGAPAMCLGPGQGDPLEEETATHSSVLAWGIPGRRSLVGYSSLGCRVRHAWRDWGCTQVCRMHCMVLSSLEIKNCKPWTTSEGDQIKGLNPFLSTLLFGNELSVTKMSPWRPKRPQVIYQTVLFLDIDLLSWIIGLVKKPISLHPFLI